MFCLTCDRAFAGISSGQGPDTVGRIRNLIASILDEDGVSARHVRHIRHQVGPIVVVTNVRLLEFSLWILRRKRRLPDPTESDQIFVCVENVRTHGDLHCQQALARIFGVDGELNGHRGGYSGSVEAGPARTHLTGIMGREDFHLVRADGQGLNSNKKLKLNNEN